MAHPRPIDKEFEDADDTGVLVISGRNLRQFPNVPGDLLDYGDVFEADFSKNRFDRVPREVLAFKAVVKLDFYHNNLRYIPEELSMLTCLRELNFSRNYLQAVPPELCQMDLHSLNLSNNRLVSLPVELGKLNNLLYLSLSCNKLQELPNSFCQLFSLQHLNLHRNELRDLPADIYKLENLIHLDISANSLTQLPTSLRQLEALQTLHSHNNPLESPPTQVCMRGLVHISKYLGELEKRGSDPYLLQSQQRDESIRRRKDRLNKRNSGKPMSESTPIRNGQDTSFTLVDEMKSFINMTIGEPELKNDGETTPTGTLHWSVRQYMTPETASGLSAQSKEDYREAAHRLYMQQERHKTKLKMQRSSSPPASSTRDQSHSGSQFNTLPKRRSEENVYASVTNEIAKTSGRSLPNERVPRSGSWNSHRRIASPVLPSKYVAPSHDQRTKGDGDKSGKKDGEKTEGKIRHSLQSKSASDLLAPNASTPESPPKTKSPSRSKKKPTPLDSSTPKTEKKSPRLNIPTSGADGDSDREGSITPTNETPPGSPEGPTTPKGQKTFHSLDNLLTATNGEPEAHAKKVGFSSAENLSTKSTTSNDRPSVLPVRENSEDGVPDLEIFEMEGSPTSVKRRVPSIPDVKEPVQSASPKGSPKVTWSSLPSPRRKKEKDVFKFLKESDPNYTIRRQQLQMNIILEKNRHVKKAVENLLGVQLSDDIGEWVTDGVILCQIINKLHPDTVAHINEPPSGQQLSRIKKTVNISAFIEACKKLKVPEEHLCSAGDIIEMRDPVRVITCLQRVLETKPGNLI